MLPFLLLLACEPAPVATPMQVVSTTPPQPQVVAETGWQKSPSGLRWAVLQEGSGEIPRQGQQVELRYAGWRADGRYFDGSRSHFATLGQGQLLEAWEEAISSMNVGEKRQLRVPPHLGFADRSVGDISPTEELTFEIELLSIR